MEEVRSKTYHQHHHSECWSAWHWLLYLSRTSPHIITGIAVQLRTNLSAWRPWWSQAVPWGHLFSQELNMEENFFTSWASFVPMQSPLILPTFIAWGKKNWPVLHIGECEWGYIVSGTRLEERRGASLPSSHLNQMVIARQHGQIIVKTHSSRHSYRQTSPDTHTDRLSR
jgi:hypothetical protein